MTMGKKKLRTMDLILVLMGVVLLSYTVVVLIGWMATGTEPGVLTTCVFAVCGFECGVMGWIKTTKEPTNKSKKLKTMDLILVLMGVSPFGCI